MTDTAAGWLLGLAVSAAIVPLSRRTRRAAAAGCWSLLLLYVVVLALANALLAEEWRAVAPAFAAAAVWLATQPLRAFGSLSANSIGLVPPQPGSLGPAVAATAAVFALEWAMLTTRGLDPVGVSTAMVVAAMVAAVVEEIVMRGVLLALADEALPPPRSFIGAPIGAGGLLLTIAFVALHGLHFAVWLGVAPLALLYLWLRARTGSLAAPIVAHLLWNLVVILVHR